MSVTALRPLRRIRPDRVRPGDLADHKSGRLDPRRVARIEGDSVWLYFLTDNPVGPFRRLNYTYARRVDQ